jgi:hypothetical protein
MHTMTMLPPSASTSSSSEAASFIAEMPMLTSFLHPPAPFAMAAASSSSSSSAASVPLIVARVSLPDVRSLEADDSASDSDATSSYTQAQSFPDTRANQTRRPFILSQLQEASATQHQHDDSESTSETASRNSSPAIVAATSSPTIKRLSFAAKASHEEHKESPIDESQSAPPPAVITAKLDANAAPFTAALFTDEVGGYDDASEMAAPGEEGIMDPLYNDLTDLRSADRWIGQMIRTEFLN